MNKLPDCPEKKWEKISNFPDSASQENFNYQLTWRLEQQNWRRFCSWTYFLYITYRGVGRLRSKMGVAKWFVFGSQNVPYHICIKKHIEHKIQKWPHGGLIRLIKPIFTCFAKMYFIYPQRHGFVFHLLKELVKIYRLTPRSPL